jgi:hypothetical protein
MRRVPLRLRVLGSPLQLHKHRVLLPGSSMLSKPCLSPVLWHKPSPANRNHSSSSVCGVNASNAVPVVACSSSGLSRDPWGCCNLDLDFGEVAAGEQLEREFFVTNTCEYRGCGTCIGL